MFRIMNPACCGDFWLLPCFCPIVRVVKIAQAAVEDLAVSGVFLSNSARFTGGKISLSRCFDFSDI